MSGIVTPWKRGHWNGFHKPRLIWTQRSTCSSGRYLYAVFMCHLAIEKALKGLFYEKRRQFPPKSHNLVHLLNQIGVKPPEEFGRFAIKLSEASIPTRYPEDMAKAQQNYPEDVTQDLLAKGKGFIVWIKEQL